MEHKVELKSEDIVRIALPNGQVVTVQLSEIDSAARPEIHICFDQTMTVNCWMEGMIPSVPFQDLPSVLPVQMLVIPVERS